MNEAAAPGPPSLTPKNPRPRRIRIAVLVAVHLLLLTHLLLYYGFGRRSIGSIDFQEFFRSFLKEGVLNAGAIFAGAVFLTTLLFGRVFCGWACHFGAFQELCHALLKRTPLKAAATHSLWLKAVPVVALAYFILRPNLIPVLQRGVPPVRLDLAATPIWELLPGPAIAAAMFLFDGVLIVLFFGTRAFCRLICPWGLMLKPFNSLSMSTVAKVDHCRQCRRCTEACQMGIDVMDYVNREGRVDASECIKCLNCVSVCPQGALAFRFKPGIALRNLRTRYAAPPGFSGWEGFFLLLTTAGALAALSHLGTISPLLAAAVGAVAGHGAIVLVRTRRRPESRWLGLLLKRDRRWRPGGVLLATATLGLGAVILMGAAYKISTRAANRRLKEEAYASALLPLKVAQWLSPREADLRLAAANAYFRTGQVDRAIESAREAVRLAPDSATPRLILADSLEADGRIDEALDQVGQAARLDPANRAIRLELCSRYAQLHRAEEARACLREGVESGALKERRAPPER